VTAEVTPAAVADADGSTAGATGGRRSMATEVASTRRSALALRFVVRYRAALLRLAVHDCLARVGQLCLIWSAFSWSRALPSLTAWSDVGCRIFTISVDDVVGRTCLVLRHLCDRLAVLPRLFRSATETPIAWPRLFAAFLEDRAAVDPGSTSYRDRTGWQVRAASDGLEVRISEDHREIKDVQIGHAYRSGGGKCNGRSRIESQMPSQPSPG